MSHPQADQWIAEFLSWRNRAPDECDRVLQGVRALKLHRPTRIFITTDGFMFPFERPISIPDIHTVLGADSLDTVTLADYVHVMSVDDHGEAKNLPVNELATRFYFQKCGGPVPFVIRGDVVITPDEDHAPAHMRLM